jgi:prepilin-type N-terminal cleavage/methylation domain-containing protein
LSKSFKLIRGFTFLEVLAALVILSVALIPIMLWVPTSIQTKLQTERKTIAIFLCQSKIEELHYKIIKNFGTDYDQASTSFYPPYPDFKDFRYMVTDNSAGTYLKTISVSVWHTETPENATIFYTRVASR